MTTAKTLMKDPLNLLVIGVGGQGNVVISQLISEILVKEGFYVTFAQSYGSAQRGGTVLNYVRISNQEWVGPLPPDGQADVIVALEPVEAMRMLGRFGNPDVFTIVNPRPIYPMEMAGGTVEYPDPAKLIAAIRGLSRRAWVIQATEEAQELGNPILANVIVMGAIVGTGLLPLDKETVGDALRERFPKAVDLNLSALQRGMELAVAV